MKTRSAKKKAVSGRSAARRPAAPPAKQNAVLKRSADVLARRNPDGGIAILRVDNEDFFYNIDGIAAEFWQLIDGKATISEIKAKLIRKHAPPVARFEKDVAKFVADLRREKLVLS